MAARGPIGGAAWRSMLGWYLGTALALLASPGQAVPQAILPAQVADLRPGDFLWTEGAASDGTLTIVVSLPLQRAYIFRGTVLIATSTVSTGRPGYETPAGDFTILQKAAVYRSRKYHDAPMPHMQRLTTSGVAMHGGDLPGVPDSHGCIRLPYAFAARLFAITHLGDLVIVTDDPRDPAEASTALPPL